MHAYPRAKIGSNAILNLINLDFYHFFYNKRLFHTKKHLEGNCYIAFKEICWSCFFFKIRTRKLKLGYQMWTSTNFSVLMHSEKHIKMSLCMEFEENR